MGLNASEKNAIIKMVNDLEGHLQDLMMQTKGLRDPLQDQIKMLTTLKSNAREVGLQVEQEIKEKIATLQSHVSTLNNLKDPSFNKIMENFNKQILAKKEEAYDTAVKHKADNMFIKGGFNRKFFSDERRKVSSFPEFKNKVSENPSEPIFSVYHYEELLAKEYSNPDFNSISVSPVIMHALKHVIHDITSDLNSTAAYMENLESKVKVAQQRSTTDRFGDRQESKQTSDAQLHSMRAEEFVAHLRKNPLATYEGSSKNLNSGLAAKNEEPKNEMTEAQLFVANLRMTHQQVQL